MLNFWVLYCCLLCLTGAFRVSGKVVLIGDNVTLSFEDTEANFAPSVKGSRRCGTLDVAEPLNACSHLINKVVPKMNDTIYPFVLAIRGGCSFDYKVRRAQAAGFKAAIVYDNENGDLVAMAGTSAGIKINAVFVSKASGEILAKYAGVADTELWIIPNFEGSAWSIMVMSFIALLSMCALLAACFFVQRNRIRRQSSQTPCVREFHGMSSRLVKAMPSLTFTAVLEDDCTSRTCAICLEDYNAGEKLRILPCHHKFHSTCVDVWLTSWRTFCPVCKHDARSNACELPASESTPLLLSSPGSVSPSSVLSSMRPSLLASSSALPVGPSSHRSPSVSCPQSIPCTPYNQHSLQSHRQSPHQTTSQSSTDPRIMSSQRSNSAYSVSPRSHGHSSLSFLNSGLMSQCIPSPGNASSSYYGSSSRWLNPLHSSESASSFLPSHSPPECE